MFAGVIAMNLMIPFRLALSFATLALAFSAQAVVLDFEGLPGADLGNYNSYGPTITVQGFQLDCTEFGSWNPVATAATDFSNYTGSNALFDNLTGDITLTKVGGGTFTLAGIDVANIYRQSYAFGPKSATVTFIGTFADASTVSRTFVTAASDALQHASLSGFSNVTSVKWRNDVGSYHQFDNLTIDPVPEPAGLAALGLGLAGALRRRRAR